MNTKKSTLRHKNAFTLVEIIVTIAILLILALLAYITLTGYGEKTRDSTRMTNIQAIMSSLDLYHVHVGNYPMPSYQVQNTYQGGVVWHQGTVGESVLQSLNRLHNLLSDPLTGTPYTYSVTSERGEYLVGSILEGSLSISYKPHLFHAPLFASTPDTATAYVQGDYNGVAVKVSTGSNTYILALPTIISSDTHITDVTQLTQEKKLVYNGYHNLPSSYEGTQFEMLGGFDYVPSDFVAYSGTHLSLTEYEDKKIQMTKTLQRNYCTTLLKNKGNIKPLTSTVIDPNNPSGYAKRLSYGTAQRIGVPINKQKLFEKIDGEGTSSQDPCEGLTEYRGPRSDPGDGGGKNPSGSFYFSANQAVSGSQIQIVNTCSVDPSSYTSSDERVAYVVGDKIVVVGPGTFTIFQHGGDCNTNSITNTISPSGSPGNFTIGAVSEPQTTYSFSSPLYLGSNGYIHNNCSTPPTSYTSSNPSVAIISGNTIITIATGSTIITPVDGDCDVSDPKTLQVITPQTTPVGHPPITYPAIVVGMTFTITDDCTISPTGYASSDETIAVIYGKTIHALKAGSTYISPVGGLCADNNPKPLTVHAPVGDFSLSSSAVSPGTNVLISENCSIHPTSFTSSNSSVATIHNKIIVTHTEGTTNIAQVGGSCSNNTPKVLTVGNYEATEGGGSVGASFTYQFGHEFSCGGCE